MKFLDEATGKVINEIVVGAPVVVQPTVGKDSQGNSKIFAIIGATRLAGAANFGLGGQSDVPGTIIALGLSDKAASASTSTVTTTAVSSSTTTVTTATTVTETTGLPAEITYAIAAVAVIAIIGAAVLVMRKK